MKTKLFAFIALMLLPLGMAAQSDPVGARLEAKYGFACRQGKGTSTAPFYYTVKRDGKEGACDANGREIIPPSRYDFVCRLGDGTSTDPFYYSVERDGKYGACDANGREIIPPVYDDFVIYNNDVLKAKINGEWVSLGIGLTPDGTAKGTYTPAPGYSVEARSKEKSNGLLYKGTYTRSGEAYMVEEKRWADFGEDWSGEVEIYHDHINMMGRRFEFDHIDSDNNSIVFLYEEERDGTLIFHRISCLVSDDSSNYDLTYEIISVRAFFFATYRFKMAKGVVKIPRHKK